MRFTKPLLYKLFFIAFIMIQGVVTMAQSTGDAKNTDAPYNMATILMVSIALVLAFVIYGLGQVLVTLTRQAVEKKKSSGITLPVILLSILSFVSLAANANDGVTEEIGSVATNYGGMESTAFWLLASVILLEAITIGFLLLSIKRVQAELLPQKEIVKTAVFKEWWSAIDKRLFTKAVAVEQEADILLDHDYDGIRELDNALPPWWKYGFYITIAISFIYMLNFHVLGYGQNPTEEYQAELVKAQEAKDLYESKNADKINESNLEMPKAGGLDAGKEIFNSICWTCHGKLGEGGAGPNLTDDNWLHKGSLSDIYLSIKHGYPDKGMQAWEKSYSPKEILNLAGYIKNLKGTNPAGAKAPQGDIYIETNSTDSTAATGDTSNTNK
ncbi:MAG: cbb3-type cytochrome c oxidase N-terminal domain-containing protein [Ferruginibacter sp.]